MRDPIAGVRRDFSTKQRPLRLLEGGVLEPLLPPNASGRPTAGRLSRQTR